MQNVRNLLWTRRWKRAEGEAQSVKLISEAIKKEPGFVELRRMDAAKEVATTISRSANKVT